MIELTLEQLQSMLQLAGITAHRVYLLQDQYLPDSYVMDRAKRPWFLVKTPFGLLEIGPRKRVIEFDWKETNLRKTPPVEEGKYNSTRSETNVHSYSQEELLYNLKWFSSEMKELQRNERAVATKQLREDVRLAIRDVVVNAEQIRAPFRGGVCGIAVTVDSFRKLESIHDAIAAGDRIADLLPTV